MASVQMIFPLENIFISTTFVFIKKKYFVVAKVDNDFFQSTMFLCPEILFVTDVKH